MLEKEHSGGVSILCIFLVNRKKYIKSNFYAIIKTFKEVKNHFYVSLF